MSKKGLSKSIRVLALFEKLYQSESVCREEMAEFFDCSTKTIKRDIEELKVYLHEFYNHEKEAEITYDKSKGTYILKKEKRAWLTNKEVLGLAKILLESRAFCKEELNNLVEKLILHSFPPGREYIKDVTRNEVFHYQSVNHEKPLLDLLWSLSKSIKERRIVEIEYNRPDKEEEIYRAIEPLGIMFSEYYFYIIAHRVDQDDDFKITYRIDRIKDLNISDKHFKIPYVDRFEEGKFRKRVQFMFPGKLLKIKFKFWGRSVEAVLDRLPTAIIEKKVNDNTYIINAEVYGKGIKMWLLSQGQYLEVMEPENFRAEMKSTIEEMAKLY